MGQRNYLVEGVSGTGKTTVCDELARRGHQAVHGDRELAYQGDPETGEPLEGASHEHHVWDLERVRALLADRSRPLTFLCGGSRNWHRFVEDLDGVFVLDVDRTTLEQRLDRRPADEFGAAPAERDLVLRLHATEQDVPDGVRVDATRPVVEVVDDILRHVGAGPAGDDLTGWLLTQPERGNPWTRVDDVHPGPRAWSEGNLVRPLVHGATYFAELCERIAATRPGDLVLFTDWQGDADQRLTEAEDSHVVEVLGSADERGVDVRGLVWRSHSNRIGFTAEQNHDLGRRLQERGVEAILDMRVRQRGSHHQKLVVIRHRDDPTRDIAYVGGIDLAHSRRDDRDHGGDPQALDNMPDEYGPTPPWHDIQAAITGPAVHDVETTFRERWEDPTTLLRSPIILTRDKLRGLDTSPDPLPPQAPPPPPVPGATHVVQLLRTYPDLRGGRDYAFADGGERSVARGYSKAVEQARRLVYVEDQYLWGRHVGNVFTDALRAHDDLHVIVVVPLHPDVEGLNRVAQREGRRRAMAEMTAAAPDRVGIFGIENHAGTPVYVHAKTCMVDDTWASIGSDNFNRRSWTHDSELSCVVVDRAGAYARDLRLTLAAEHLDREPHDPEAPAAPGAPGDMSDCVDPAGMLAAYAACADALDAWHEGGRRGPRPPGRLRRLPVPEVGWFARLGALPLYLAAHDPDGRPRSLRRRDAF
ncbi:hypothetical protein GCM10023340_18390 [Nocardioides marinquilinus]|uniref:PLD phosphodiesterase domain-containing protein n=1 Tax=Nocardioides marinquilinus TaxID=1210400 RepID=A0ABP9PI01_9ACTN